MTSIIEYNISGNRWNWEPDEDELADMLKESRKRLVNAKLELQAAEIAWQSLLEMDAGLKLYKKGIFNGSRIKIHYMECTDIGILEKITFCGLEYRKIGAK